MGIELSAVIEVAQTRDDGTVFWWEVATLEFNKNYVLNGLLSEEAGLRFISDQGQDVKWGWPKDTDALHDERYDDCDQGRRWCTGGRFIRLVESAPASTDDDWDWRGKQVKALVAFLQALAPWETRILFYEM